jgi:hypothetical protein
MVASVGSGCEKDCTTLTETNIARYTIDQIHRYSYIRQAIALRISVRGEQ